MSDLLISTKEAEQIMNLIKPTVGGLTSRQFTDNKNAMQATLDKAHLEASNNRFTCWPFFERKAK